MNAPKRHSTGFTLVELLVVIAIVALVAGIAVPGMARLMGYGRNNIDNAARDVYGLLRAANVYASTFRVNTAVVYTVGTATDSVFNAPAMVVNGIGMARARAFSEEELAQLASDGEDASVIAEIREYPDSVYVLVLGEEGQLRKLPNYSCIQSSSSDMSVLELAANPTEFGDRMTV
ncbi:MAG: prepilin-type N-terminal cleavage/methylation domain-containing protein, partial [Candidatus Hydrogenedentales bacterium]